MLDFHRRTAKPAWWAMFSRMEMAGDELLDDGECLAGLTPDPANPPRQEKRSIVYTYHFPEQGSKLKTGDSAAITQTGDPVRELKVDENNRRVSFKRTANKEPLPEINLPWPRNARFHKGFDRGSFPLRNSIIENNGDIRRLKPCCVSRLPKIRGTAGRKSRRACGQRGATANHRGDLQS